MDDEELIQYEDREREHDEEEPHLTILQSVGLIVLLIILQLLSSLLLTRSQSTTLDDSSWLNIAITHAIAGFLTAKAGAILAGFSLAALFLPLNIRVKDLLFVIISVAGIMILSSELSNVLQSIQPISESYLELFNRLFQQNLAGVILAIGIIAPVTEEIIFRGVMFEGLKKKYPVSIAFFASTFLFSAVHILPWLVINAFLIGCFLAWIKLRTESLALCVVAHSLYNSFPFLIANHASMQVRGFSATATAPIEFQPWWFDLIGVALVAAGVAGIHFFTRNASPLMAEKPPET